MTGYIHVQYQHDTPVNTMKSVALPRYVSSYCYICVHINVSPIETLADFMIHAWGQSNFPASWTQSDMAL